MKKYQRPVIEEIKFDVFTHLLAGSVRNNNKKIMNGSPTFEDNEEGDGDDAAAKANPFLGWDD